MDTPDFPEFELPMTVQEGIDQIPAQYRGFYSPGENGTMVLSDPVLKHRLDNGGLQAALAKERNRAREQERIAKDSDRRLKEALRLLGVESFEAMPGRIEELKRAPAAGRDEAVVAYQRQLEGKDSRIGQLTKALSSQMIDAAANAAIMEVSFPSRSLAEIRETGNRNPRHVAGCGDASEACAS